MGGKLIVTWCSIFGEVGGKIIITCCTKQLKMFLKISGGQLPVAAPLDAGLGLSKYWRQHKSQYRSPQWCHIPTLAKDKSNPLQEFGGGGGTALGWTVDPPETCFNCNRVLSAVSDVVFWDTTLFTSGRKQSWRRCSSNSRPAFSVFGRDASVAEVHCGRVYVILLLMGLTWRLGTMQSGTRWLMAYTESYLRQPI